MAANLKMPQFVKDDKRAAQVFRQVNKYLKEFGALEAIDADMVAAYSVAVSEYEYYTEVLRKEGHLYKDKNKQTRRHPALIARKQAGEDIRAYSKQLGIDRSFREKGRGEQLSKGRRPVDKIGKLRKVS